MSRLHLDPRVAEAMPAALELVGAVKTSDSELVAEILRASDVMALAVALAGLVDDTRSMRSLTTGRVQLRPSCHPRDWGPSAGSTAVHGTRSRYNAGCRGTACRDADRAYQQARYLRRKASA